MESGGFPVELAATLTEAMFRKGVEAENLKFISWKSNKKFYE